MSINPIWNVNELFPKHYFRIVSIGILLWLCSVITNAAGASEPSLTVYLLVHGVQQDKSNEMHQVLEGHLYDLQVAVSQISVPKPDSLSAPFTPSDYLEILNRQNVNLNSVGSIVVVNTYGVSITILEKDNLRIASNINLDKRDSWSTQCDAAAVVVRSAVISRLNARQLEETQNSPQPTPVDNTEQITPKKPVSHKSKPTSTISNKTAPVILWSLNYTLFSMDMQGANGHAIGGSIGFIFNNLLGPKVTFGFGWAHPQLTSDLNEAIVFYRIPARLQLAFRRNAGPFSIGASLGTIINIQFLNNYPSKTDVEDTSTTNAGATASIYSTVNLGSMVALMIEIGADLLPRSYRYIWEDYSILETSSFQPYLSLGIQFRHKLKRKDL